MHSVHASSAPKQRAEPDDNRRMGLRASASEDQFTGSPGQEDQDEEAEEKKAEQDLG